MHVTPTKMPSEPPQTEESSAEPVREVHVVTSDKWEIDAHSGPEGREYSSVCCGGATLKAMTIADTAPAGPESMIHFDSKIP